MSADRWLVPEPTASIPPAADGLLAGRRTDDRMSSRKPHRIKKGQIMRKSAEEDRLRRWSGAVHSEAA
ncbi:unnamed protein product [Spirodela intermedia]|uniref:Uncharacterized protein n=1 Tax=Spirodela intermedia TaxID=51605 RepID=A0A7I8J6I6_SPIIN|nr:unnamed protein product [Spirodela intermedia]CAA6665013.1 unnamed protein product [Spirodela intermedia]